jgi:hypothetical protein
MAQQAVVNVWENLERFILVVQDGGPGKFQTVPLHRTKLNAKLLPSGNADLGLDGANNIFLAHRHIHSLLIGEIEMNDNIVDVCARSLEPVQKG